MQIIEPSFTLRTPFSEGLTRLIGVRMLRFIEHEARLSHFSQDKQTDESWERFIHTVVLQHGDWSVTEHASITAEIRTDRGVTHELVRHRMFSFTQESTRFVRYNDELEFVYPAEMSKGYGLRDWHWDQAMVTAEREYRELLDKKVRPQEARSVLPTALAASIAMTGNLRAWRWFFLMRTTKESHPDMRRITIPMLAEFAKNVPLLYDDIVPEMRQIDNERLPK